MSKSLNILLVEDDEIISEATITSLKKMGHSICLAMTGNSALKRITEPFDLILMDVQLPDMTGLEVTRRFREIDKKTPIVAFTNAQDIDDLEQKCLAAGMNDRVEKPLSPQNFKKFIEKIEL